MTQYRKLYADYYGITWDAKEMEVHHVDYIHSNNDIHNLILLPKGLHRKLHEYYNALYMARAKYPATDDFLTTLAREVLLVGMSPVGDLLGKYQDTLDECDHWSLLRKVGYNTPFGEHITHITPNTKIFG